MPYSHFHNSYEIYILKSGERTVTIDETDYNVSANDVTLFDKNIPHRSTGVTPFSGICIKFTDRFMNNYFTAAAKRTLLKCFNCPVIRLSDPQLAEIRSAADIFDRTNAYNFTVLARILAIMDHAAEQSLVSDENKERKNPSKTTAERLIEYVDNNYTAIENAAELTALFSISDSYIYKIFKKRFNTTPNKYIYQLRINCACHWLEITDRTVKSIALSCGFKSSEHFIRVFKTYKHCTPGEYRNRSISGEHDDNNR